MRTRHAQIFGAPGYYQYSSRETIQAIRAYAQSEPRHDQIRAWGELMRLAISNIAWDTAEDEAIATLLHRFGVDAIDVAPGKYFPEPAKATDEEIARVKNWWSERGIEITGMQALLFGTTGLNVFGPPEFRMRCCNISLQCAASAQVWEPRDWYLARRRIGIAPG